MLSRDVKTGSRELAIAKDGASSPLLVSFLLLVAFSLDDYCVIQHDVLKEKDRKSLLRPL